MANFDNSQPTIQSMNQATGVLNAVRGAYAQLKTVQAFMALYTANTNPPFNAAVNTLFTPAERSELGNIAGDMGALITELETNHRSALGLPPLP